MPPDSKVDDQELARFEGRFILRANAVFFARGIFLLVYSINFLLPKWRVIDFGLNQVLVFLVLVGLCFNLLIARKLSSHRSFGRWVNFISLGIEIIWLSFLVFKNGGLTSPLLAAVPVYTILYALLFHSVIATMPPLLVLPLITALDLGDGISISLPEQILFLVFYSSLNLICLYLTTYSLAREEHQSREILKLEKNLKGLAVIEERQRLAREIHDGLGGQLSGLILQSEYLLTLLASKPEWAREVEELKHSAEEAIEEVRRALAMMYDHFDLIPQLHTSCTTFSSRHRLPVNLQVKGIPPVFTHEQQLTIFRIMQECLTNIAKHAKASRVNVDVNFLPSGLQMQIKDDGIGFDPSVTPRNHYGLLNIRERAQKVGGKVDIQSSPGIGTHVDLSIHST